VEGVGAAADELEPPPVHPAGLLVLLERLVEGGDAPEDGGLPVLDGLEDGVEIGVVKSTWCGRW